MKRNYWTLVVALVLILALALVLGARTVWLDRAAVYEQELDRAGLKADGLQTQLYYASLKEPPSYVLPLELVAISSPVGYRVNPMGGTEEALHKGVDLVAAVGTPVRAALAGTVKEHWLTPGWHHGRLYHGHFIMGGMIVIDHGEFFTVYGHLSATYVHEDDRVEAGQLIGLVGNTGLSTGPHLHFELVVKPLEYLKEKL